MDDVKYILHIDTVRHRGGVGIAEGSAARALMPLSYMVMKKSLPFLGLVSSVQETGGSSRIKLALYLKGVVRKSHLHAHA